MRKLTFLFILGTLLLAACGGAAPTQAPAPAQPTQAAEQPAQPTQAPEQPVQPTEESALPTDTGPLAEATPTQAPAPEAPAGGAVLYQIAPGESTVSYEVGETFFNQDNRFNLAIGVTPEIRGEIQLDAANPHNSSIGVITVDISQFASDSSRRDGAIRDRWLESARYPLATFTPTAIEGLPDSYTEGQEITFKVTGNLTVRTVTRPVTFDVTARLQGGALTGAATTTILMSDFEFGPIEIAGMLGTENEVKITLLFVARP